MFRVIELVHEGMDPSELDRLIPPEDLQLLVIYSEFERIVDPRRPAVLMNAWTHMISGRWPGDEELRVWVPKMGPVTYRGSDLQDVYMRAPQWVRQWAEEREVDSLAQLNSSHYALIEALEVEVGFPQPRAKSTGQPSSGRLRRPEVLQQVATNLLHRAEDGTLPPAYGREALIEELASVLTGSHPAHICLVGPNGVGKTALIQEAARRVHLMGRAYQSRRDLWQTSGDRIIAGMSIIGQWEQRAEQICAELAARGDTLVVDDLLGLVRAGRTLHGDSNVARFIEPYLEQGRFGLVTEATEHTWELARELAPGFVDKFRRIQVPELDHVATLAIVGEQVRDLESYHSIRFTPDGIEAVLHHSRRFFRQEAFPGKAIQLVKQCFNEALRRFAQELVDQVKIDANLVADVLHRQTGLPLSILKQDERRGPGAIRAAFESKVFGQPEAMDAMTRLVLTIEQGVSQPGRPLGTFLLIGPSGVGKTETARALATDLFGSADRMVRFDMSEFAEPMALTRLIGTANRPDGELTGKVRLQPFSVLLFDEVEKANSRVLDLLLQVLGDGRLTDAAGRTVDFCNTVVMMTSNLGAENEERWLGFAERKEPERILHYRRSAEQFFRPEMFNRIDRVIAYRPLENETLRRIGRRTVRELLSRRGLRQGQIVVDIDPRLIESLATRSVDRRYGARTLERRIERELITPLARELSRVTGNDDLTLVTMRPGSGEEAIELRVNSLARAPKVLQSESEKGVEEPLSDAENLETLLRRIVAGVEALEGLPQTRTLLAEYEEILGRLNVQAASGTWSEELSERLRYREMFRNTLENLRSRLDGLLEVDSAAKAQVPDTEALSKATRLRWIQIAMQIDRHLAWAEAQLASLADKEREGAMLILRGISGPCQPVLQRWHRWLERLAHRLDFQLQCAFYVGDDWGEEPRWESVEAIAVATECPGALALFRVLDGYVWHPGPASQGQHVLLQGLVCERGVADDAGLVEAVKTLFEEHRDGSDEEDGRGGRFIEFVEQEGAVEDLRLGRKLAMPEDRSRAGDFMVDLLMGRVQLLAGHLSEEAR